MAKRNYSAVPTIVNLAAAIESDIRRRGLRPGDPYQSTFETTRMLGVSATAANRALQYLVKRQVIHRRQRKGTFIAEPGLNLNVSPLGRVHLLVHEKFLKTEGLLADGAIIGLQGEVPGAQVQFSFMQHSDNSAYCETLIAEAMRSPKPEGLVLVRAPLEVHKQVRASGLPAVVVGLPYPSVPGIPSVVTDQAAMGRLLVDHLLSKGCRQFGLLMREPWLPGEHCLLDSVYQVLGEHGISGNRVKIRTLPHDRDAVACDVEGILAQSDGQTGLLCRSLPIAEAADAHCQSTGQRARVEIVVCDVYSAPEKKVVKFPFTRPLAGPIEIGHLIGRLLARQARHKPVVLDRQVLPVVLELPGE